MLDYLTESENLFQLRKYFQWAVKCIILSIMRLIMLIMSFIQELFQKRHYTVGTEQDGHNVNTGKSKSSRKFWKHKRFQKLTMDMHLMHQKRFYFRHSEIHSDQHFKERLTIHQWFSVVVLKIAKNALIFMVGTIARKIDVIPCSQSNNITDSS